MIQAVIFDMNGVIIDDERDQEQAWRQFCQKHELTVAESDFASRIMGRPERATFEYLFGYELTNDEVDALSRERVALAQAIIGTNLPGITGLAQVRGYRGETKDIEQMIRRVDSDIEYINNWSLWLDFKILLKTIPVVVFGIGAK